MSRSRSLRRSFVPAAMLAATISFTGCSQITALAPVSGGPLQTVRVGILDVLVQEGVPILVAPVCTQQPTQFTCIGSTIDGREIRAVATLSTPYTMSVTIGGDVLYDGDVQIVIDAASVVAP